MICPECGSQNVTIQAVEEFQLKTKHHSIFYWLFIGWWLELLLWIFLTIPRLLIAMFGHKRQKLVSTTKSICVCQNCGHHWEANKNVQYVAPHPVQPQPTLDEKYADNPIVSQIIKQHREEGQSDTEIEAYIESIA